jgi:uncharacterized protein YqgC (DUF456 family)
LDIVQRAKAMVLSPAAEWRVIEPESGDPAYLVVNYVAFLAAIPPASFFLRGLLFGWRGPQMGFHHFHHFGFFSGLFGAVVHWLVALVVVYALAVIIDALAPTFSAQKNQQNAMKLAVYSSTRAWLAGVFALIPGLGIFRLVALIYSLYVFLARPADPDEATARQDRALCAGDPALRDCAVLCRRRDRRAGRIEPSPSPRQSPSKDGRLSTPYGASTFSPQAGRRMIGASAQILWPPFRLAN